MFVRISCALLAGACAFNASAQQVTYTKDVAPIFFKHCVECHRPGDIGPFAMTDFETTRAWAKAIQKAVHTREMPPWHADSSKVEYANDRSLSQEEIDTIVKWVDQGAKRGNMDDMPPLPDFENAWAMGDPDLVLNAENPFTVPVTEGNVRYQSIYFEAKFDEDLYVTAWEILPSNKSLVHHANLVRAPKKLDHVGIGQAVQAGGDYIGSYLPGARPMAYPEGSALRIPKDSIVQIQVHYVGADEPLTDYLKFGMKLANGRIDKIIRTCGTDEWEIEIEPHDDNWVMDSEVKLLQDVTLHSSGAHMHLRGRGYTTTVKLPDGTEKLITDVPVYDFNWQSNYELAHPVEVPAGTLYHVRARWDNSEKNPHNPDPAQKVVYGSWTENEMLTTWSHITLTNEKLGLKCENGRIVGRFEDAQESTQPFLLQSLPATFTRGAN